MAATTTKIHIATMRNLLLSLIQKRFLSTTSSPLPPSSFTVQYLVNPCGLSLQSALSVSQKFQLDENNIHKSQTVLQFLKSHGFTDTHIAKMITKFPAILQCKVENNLKPKFDFFTKNGFVGQLLPEIFISDLFISRRNLDSHIKPRFELLQPFFDSNERFVAALKRSRSLLSFHCKGSLRANIDFLIKGVTVDKATKIFMWQPRLLQLRHDKVVFAVNVLKNLGLDPKTPVFVHALRVVAQMSESTWNKKIEVMKTLGWTEEEIMSAFKLQPHLLECSEKKITSNMNFLLNTMKMGKQTVVECPLLLMYSVDRRLRPRHAVLKVLESKKQIKGGMKIERLLQISEKQFSKRYVLRYADQVPGLFQIYSGYSEANKKGS